MRPSEGSERSNQTQRARAEQSNFEHRKLPSRVGPCKVAY